MTAVEIRDVHKSFKIYHERNNTLKSAIMRGRMSVSEDFHALKGVTLDVPKGSTFALVGDNGSGKSTLLKCIAKILVPNSGTITRHGRIAAMLEVGSGFHPELSGHDNIYLNASILGMTRAEIDARYDDILEFSGVADHIDQPVKNYSSGMYVRLGFSVAIHTEPDILLVDEVLAVGDAAFQEKCMRKFVELKDEGRTVIVVSHSMQQLKQMADQAAWINNGVLEMVGDADTVLDHYADSTRFGAEFGDGAAVRWGTGEAKVDRLEILGGDDAPLNGPIVPGAPVTFRFHYTAHEPIAQPVFALALSSSDGTKVWEGNTRDLDFPIIQISGTGTIDLTVSNLNLLPGLFMLDASIVDKTTSHVFDYLREANGFAVKSGEIKASGGYVALNAGWNNLVQGEN